MSKYISTLAAISAFTIFSSSQSSLAMWQHDLFATEEVKRNSRLDEFYLELTQIPPHHDREFYDWAQRLIGMSTNFTSAEYLVVPDILHVVRNKLHQDPRLKISNKLYAKLKFLFVSYTKAALTTDSDEVPNFAKALKAAHHIGIQLSETCESRGNIVRFIETHLRSWRSNELHIATILSFCRHKDINIGLSEDAEIALTNYMSKKTFNFARPLVRLLASCAHYRIPLPLKPLERLQRLSLDFDDKVMTLWTLAVSALNGGIDEKTAKQIIDNLSEDLIINNDELSQPNFAMLNFTCSAYKTLYDNNINIYLEDTGHSENYLTTASWNDLISQLKTRYPEIVLEKMIPLIAAPVDAYLEYNGKTFIIQFDGPKHFLFSRNSFRSNGSTKAQTILLEANGFIVIRVDYFMNENNESFKYIRKQVSKYRPKHNKPRKRKVETEESREDPSKRKRLNDKQFEFRA